MKQLTAFVLAMILLLSLTACGNPAEDDTQNSTTTTTTTTTTVAGDNTTTTTGTTIDGTTQGTDTVDTTTVTTTTQTTTTFVPSGATVPIGTKPTTTTTTTTTKPTTTTTDSAEDPNGGSTTVAPTTTTTTTATTTTTTTTVQPTGPYIVLPEVGSDIDVTKKKNRIRVSAVAAWQNDDGTIGVSLTFKNYTTNWITEETDYVEYTCYDKNGNVVQRATKLMIGVIDTKKNPVKTFEFDVPANTAEVRITKSKIVYWTEWS